MNMKWLRNLYLKTGRRVLIKPADNIAKEDWNKKGWLSGLVLDSGRKEIMIEGGGVICLMDDQFIVVKMKGVCDDF